MNGPDMPEPRKLTNLEIHSVSLIDHCPDCGAKDTSKPVKHDYGTCYHPCTFSVRGKEHHPGDREMKGDDQC